MKNYSPDCEKILVSTKALHHLLRAATGASHEIRELQALMSPPFSETNPICILINEFNSAIQDYNSEVNQQTETQTS